MKSDIQIAQETKELPITEIASHVGLNQDDLELYGYDKAKINWKAIKKARQNKHLGKLILVTSISPTPAGEGKSTITIGLGDAINNQLHKKTMIALREPSMGPVFGLKVVPLVEEWPKSFLWKILTYILLVTCML